MSGHGDITNKNDVSKSNNSIQVKGFKFIGVR
jgi:hypothetical protein